MGVVNSNKPREALKQDLVRIYHAHNADFSEGIHRKVKSFLNPERTTVEKEYKYEVSNRQITVIFLKDEIYFSIDRMGETSIPVKGDEAAFAKTGLKDKLLRKAYGLDNQLTR